ncbi:oligosaccharyl transferase, archaeosortase A system-associated [Halogranum rubrum]|uniref:dolichyl-phosphooligosaccharide-protein glycotransferase n=1 Tax=Halogranum salarium B-1 TaxID=1210908 RepID=J3JHS3_9EURY|nr:oligosaccharyl transferase, archaeosortase A system-associated [Halogranum salarium]EJN61249.1 hypothetical protein HSB1_02900 [Halogranum salarium B-1]
MSERSESADERSVLNTDGSLVDTLREKYHVPALLAVVAVMLYVRLIPYGRFIVDGEVLFSGNDAWYHLREVQYTVRNWPSTIPFDPWTYFPFGTSTGQFGTLYDQLVATVALIIGLGSPSEALVAKTLLVAPAVFGALTAIPVYLIGKRLGGRLAGVVSAVVLMLLPGTFLQRTLVGVADHNGVEPLFQAFAVFALLVAFGIAEREKPVWELVSDRDLDALRTPLLWGALAGVATALYMWVWPPGVLLVGVVGGFIVLKQVSDTVNGGSPEHIAFAGAVSMTVTGLLMLLQVDTIGFTATRFSLIQPGLAFAVALGSVFVAFLARQWESRDLSLTLFPVAIFGLILVGLGALAVVAPDAFGTIRTNLLRTVGFNAGAQTRTIAEARPFLDPALLGGASATDQILNEYGLTLFLGVVAVASILIRPLLRKGETREYAYVGVSFAVIALIFLAPGLLSAVAEPLDGAFGNIPVTSQLLGLVIVTALIVGATLLARYDAEQLFVVVWAAFITAAAFTQIRFNYYLAVVVAVLTGFLVAETVQALDLGSVTDRSGDSGIGGWQVMTLAAILLVVFAPLAGLGAASGAAWERSQNHGPGAITQWDDSLTWMQNNTPAEGNYDGAGNAQQLDYYGTYQEGQGNHDYPEGAYGVMSWWDYGHWITVQGERIPNANPFQQGANTAANFLLAPSEGDAQDVLTGMDDQQADEGNQTRYVMVDYQMATPGQKFGAPIVFYDADNVSQSDFYYTLYQGNQQQGYQGVSTVNEQRYYDSMMVRLYQYHGSSVSPQPIVLDYEMQTVTNPNTGESLNIRTLPSGNESAVKQFQNMSAARQFVAEDGTAQVGGLGNIPSERVPALEHYRLVKASESSAATQQGSGPAWVKTFERVDGATVEGSGAPANATVTARVQMNVPSQDSTFVYTQQAETNEDGEFTMTVPYSTTGYDEFGPDNGHTNVSVRANSSYSFSTGLTAADNGSIVAYSGSADVTEAQVLGEDDAAAQVQLEEQVLGNQNQNETANETASDDATATTSEGNDTATNASANTTESLSAPSTADSVGVLVSEPLAATHN